MSHYTGKFIKASTPATHVLLLELNRPPVNAFSTAFWEELSATFDKVSLDGDIHVIVLASAFPKAFTAGIDLADLSSHLVDVDPDPSRAALKFRQNLLRFQAAISSIERCSQPVIAAINGVAFGLAVDIVAACDVRYAATSTQFSIKEVDVGLAADIGSLARLPKITGNESLLRELAFTARIFDAREAQQLGLVSKVVEGSRDQVVAVALELAKTIATKSPIAVRGTKHLLLHSRDHGVQENLDYTATWNGVMLQTDDMKQAVAAFTTKKAPKFKPMPKL